MQSRQQGFTLVELIVVIVILGILAATALPKFIDLSSDARAGVMKGVEGSMRGAALMIYGKAAANGVANKPAGSVTYDSKTVSTVYGYPAAAGVAADDLGINDLVDLNPATDFDAATPGTIAHNGAKTPANCSVTYVAPTAAGGVPTITPDYSDC